MHYLTTLVKESLEVAESPCRLSGDRLEVGARDGRIYRFTAEPGDTGAVLLVS